MASFGKDVVLPLPVELESYTLGYSMDIGGSLTKLMYRSNEDIEPKDGKSRRLHFVYLTRHDTDNLAAFIRERCDCPEHNEPVTAITTGVGVPQFGIDIKTKLNIKFNNIPEFECFVRGFKYLAEHLDHEELFHRIPKECFVNSIPNAKTMLGVMLQMPGMIGLDSIPDDPFCGLDADILDANYGIDVPLYPCALVMCGSGASMLKIDVSGSYEMMDYSRRCGKSLLGLGRLLTGAKTYDDLVELAEKGDAHNINTQCQDMWGVEEGGLYSAMPATLTVFDFSKAADMDIDRFSREDLAAAVVHNLLNDLVQMCVQQAWIHKIQTLYFCGALIDHPYARKVLSECFLSKMLTEIRPEKKVTLKMTKIGAYLGTLGAWLIGMDEQK